MLFGIFALATVTTDERKRRHGSVLWFASGLFLALLIGLRRRVGGDWHAYERIFDHLRNVELGSALVAADPAYSVLNIFAADLGLGVWAVNLVCAWILHARHEVDLNLRAAWMHVMGDALGSVAAILAGLCMSLFGWYAADSVFSVVIGVLIIWGSVRLIKESTNVLLEGTPAHINLAAVEDAILATSGVSDVHDLHVWTITSGREALSAHVIHVDSISQPDLLRELRTKLHDRFGVDHLTIQMETPDFEDETFHFCHAGTACFRSER